MFVLYYYYIYTHYCYAQMELSYALSRDIFICMTSRNACGAYNGTNS